MFKYVAFVAGLMIMCVPEDASVLRFILQGGFGLTLFSLGALLAMDEAR